MWVPNIRENRKIGSELKGVAYTLNSWRFLKIASFPHELKMECVTFLNKTLADAQLPSNRTIRSTRNANTQVGINIKMDLREIVLGGMDWIHPAQALLNTAMILGLHKTLGNS
jgi:hypothetical protein